MPGSLYQKLWLLCLVQANCNAKIHLRGTVIANRACGNEEDKDVYESAVVYMSIWKDWKWKKWEDVLLIRFCTYANILHICKHFAQSHVMFTLFIA